MDLNLQVGRVVEKATLFNYYDGKFWRFEKGMIEVGVFLRLVKSGTLFSDNMCSLDNCFQGIHEAWGRTVDRCLMGVWRELSLALTSGDGRLFCLC